MEKKSKGLITIIVLLILIVLGLVCYICYDKGVFGGKKESSNNNGTKTEISEKEQDYDKEKAKKSIDKYYYEVISENIFTFKNSYDDLTKNAVAIKNITNSKRKTINCSSLYDKSLDAQKDGSYGYTVKLNSTVFDLGNFAGGGCDNGLTDYYDYEDLNTVYKDLFGKDSNIQKSDFKSGYIVYDYIENENIFVKLDCRCGGAEGPHYRNYFVQNAKTKGKNLIINVGYISMLPDNDAKDIVLKTTIAGEEVRYTEAEIQKDTFEKEFLDKYLDKLDTYEFTFKYEDDHYVFVDMQKK